jgi:hypothetical protein
LIPSLIVLLQETSLNHFAVKEQKMIVISCIIIVVIVKIKSAMAAVIRVATTITIMR